MEPSQQPTPNYDFIMQAPSRPPSRFASNDRKQRLKFVIVVSIGFIAAISLLVALFTSGGSKGAKSLVDLAAYQTELARVIAIGTTDGSSTSVKSTALTASLSLNSDLLLTQNLLKNNGVKINQKDLAVYKSTANDTKLAQAKQTNTFDEVYKQLFDEKIANYQAKLSEVFDAQSNESVRAALRSFNNNAKLLPFTYKSN